MSTFTGSARLPIAVAAILLTLFMQAAAEPADDIREVIQLWRGAAPGTEDWDGEEVASEVAVPAGKIQIKTNVTIPTITVFRPETGTSNGTAMIVLPGGAFGALAWDLEGTEIAHWLVSRGITAFLLKYRVRPYQLAPGEEVPSDYEGLVKALTPAWRIAMADGMQAVRVVRANADEYGIDPKRVGMIGFSAGAATTMGVVLNSDDDARPDFAAPIYGMLMEDSPVPADAPPLFIAASQEDETVPTARSAQIFSRWTEAGRSAELHVYTKGEHGFGMRPKGLPVDHWPAAFEAWLGSLGLLEISDAVEPARMKSD